MRDFRKEKFKNRTFSLKRVPGRVDFVAVVLCGIIWVFFVGEVFEGVLFVRATHEWIQPMAFSLYFGADGGEISWWERCRESGTNKGEQISVLLPCAGAGLEGVVGKPRKYPSFSFKVLIQGMNV